MKFRNSMMVSAALCCMTSDTGTDNSNAGQAQDFVHEVEAEVKAFIARTETDLIQDAEDAYAWLKKEYALLAPSILADLKAAAGAAIGEALSGGTAGTIVADTLTILARDGAAVLSQVKSNVVTATVGLMAGQAQAN